MESTKSVVVDHSGANSAQAHAWSRHPNGRKAGMAKYTK